MPSRFDGHERRNSTSFQKLCLSPRQRATSASAGTARTRRHRGESYRRSGLEGGFSCLVPLLSESFLAPTGTLSDSARMYARRARFSHCSLSLALAPSGVSLRRMAVFRPFKSKTNKRQQIQGCPALSRKGEGAYTRVCVRAHVRAALGIEIDN